MVLFRFLEVVEIPEIIEQVSNVDKTLEWLGNNYGLLVNIFTLIGIILSVLYTFLKIKNVNNGIGQVSIDNKTTSKVLYENQSESNKKVDNLLLEVKELKENNIKKDSQVDKLINLFVLLLQTANVPIHSKGDFLKAINEIDIKGIGDALKGLETQINNKIEEDTKEEHELDEKINNLDRL